MCPHYVMQNFTEVGTFYNKIDPVKSKHIRFVSETCEESDEAEVKI